MAIISTSGRVLAGVAVLVCSCIALASFFRPQGVSLARRAVEQFATQPQIPLAVPDASLERIVLGSKQRHNKDAVLYSFRPNDEEDEINLQFFVDHALHDKADFYLIINGHKTQVDFPDRPNIYVTRRQDECYDLGAIGAVLQQNENEVMDKYDRFILTTSKARGPFFPLWAIHNNQACWTDHLFHPLNDRTKLVGATADCSMVEHPKFLQSSVLATDREGLELIMPSLMCYDNEEDAILRGEQVMTHLVRSAGFDAVPLYARGYDRSGNGPELSPPPPPSDSDEDKDKENAIDKRSDNTWPFESDNDAYWRLCNHGDVFLAGDKGGLDAHPFDAIFVRLNLTADFSQRSASTMDLLSEWADKSFFSSYDHC
ncbi:hypothetical protein BCR37DRAFT_376692 [Protomyces lactucae-debilis]|uniref:Uncharacterized protein n=1 Tax=Protomyces lactucae-debilis TaxID=2754530 RepID=A0A1Y2FTX4_PROLT|nr:uncharacterized protein BCR37DRAFT_376692 [Protomyces lactucae-debilis]ORY86145.1 hypothetical protein BCR37DRAFT_376692 [Protomyces lactucae-debilis]